MKKKKFHRRSGRKKLRDRMFAMGKQMAKGMNVKAARFNYHDGSGKVIEREMTLHPTKGWRTQRGR